MVADPSEVYDNAMTIRVHGADGSVWNVSGRGQAAQGVFLAKGQVEGLLEAMFRQTWDSGALQIGAEQRGQWWEARDLLLGFHVVPRKWPVPVTLALFRQAFVRQVDRWDHDARPARIEVWTEMSGSRFLDVLMYDRPDFNPEMDPGVMGHGNPILKLRSGLPFFYTEEEKSVFESAAVTAGGVVTVSNPTPLPCYHKWVATRCAAWLPDFSWQGAPGARVPGVDKLSGRDDSARFIPLPLLNETHGGATVDLEFLTGNALPIRDTSDQNMIGQMPVPGLFFKYEIPPHTPATELPVSYANAPSGGARIELRMPRWWPEPFGGEWMGAMQ